MVTTRAHVPGHSFFPPPERNVGLPHSAGFGSAGARETARCSLERLTGLWDYLVDERVGIIRRVFELPLDDDDPDFFHYFSIACDTSRFSPFKNFSQNGGASTDRLLAIAKAMGEAVERYCSAIFSYQDLTFASYDNLGRPAVPPEQFALYRPEQFETHGFPWKPFTRGARVAWTEGFSLLRQEPVLVPAAMVFVPYYYLRDNEDVPFAQPISTGLACGSSPSGAAISALCEVIERDAFTLLWQARLAPPSVELETLPSGCLDIARRLADVNIDVKILDITTDVAVPTLLTIALSESAHSPAVVIAAATDPSPEVALRKSLEELVHTRKFAKQIMQQTPPIPIDLMGGYSEVVDAATHLRFYCSQEARPLIDFAWKRSPACNFSDVVDAFRANSAEQLEHLVGLLAATGLEPITRDLTTPDIRDLGLSVVRAVVPGMHPLFMGYQNRALGGSRLYTVPQRLGHPGLQPGQPDNPYPHPFP